MSDELPVKPKKSFNCRFCGSTHSSPVSWKYCESNPDRDKNRAERSAMSKKAFKDFNMEEKLVAANRTEVARIKRSNRAKQRWADGTLTNQRAGKKSGPNLEKNAKISATKKKDWHVKNAGLAKKNLEIILTREALVAPVLDMSHDFFRPKMDSNGFIETDFTENTFFDDEFDPFH